jgi:hypothetical protein
MSTYNKEDTIVAVREQPCQLVTVIQKHYSNTVIHRYDALYRYNYQKNVQS